MSERQTRFNRIYWDGLHAFSPGCYTCEFLETELCLGCSGNGSGEADHYLPAELVANGCASCLNQNTCLCEDCDGDHFKTKGDN
jgi:hypothetical protein